MLHPSPRRTALGNGLRRDVDLLGEVRDVLWPLPSSSSSPSSSNASVEAGSEVRHSSSRSADPRSSEQVRHELEALLAARLAAAPRRGKGALRSRFIRHVQAVAGRYAGGLYVSYDHGLIPQTSNEIEGLHGRVKRHLRRCSGRSSTSGGVAQTLGEWLPSALLLVALVGIEVLSVLVRQEPASRYRASRVEQRELSEPARRHRSIQRSPDRFLAALIARWTSHPGESD